MRVAGILHAGDEGRRVGDQGLFREPAHHQLLDVVLGRGLVAAQPADDRLERPILHAVERVRGLEVGGQRLVAPVRDEPLHQVPRRHHFDAPPPDRLDRPGVDAADVRNRVLGRVLHRDALDPVHQIVQPAPEVLAAGVEVRLAGEVVEGVALDGVHERPRAAGGGHEVVPAAGRHLAAVDTRQGPGDGIGTVEVVEEPAIQAVFAQRHLHCADIERHAFQYRSFVTVTAAGMSGAS